MKRILNHAVSLALLLLYSFSQLVLLIDSVGCRVSGLFYLWVALLCLTTWVTTGTRRGWLVGMPSSVLLLCFAFYVFPSNLTLQLNDALDKLTGVYLEQVVYPGDVYTYLNLTADHSLLFLFLAFLLASYMGAALSSRSGRVGLALLGSGPIFAASLAVTAQPPIPAVFGMLLFWFLLAVSGGHFEEDAESYRSVLGLALPLALLLALLIWRVDPAHYQYEPKSFDLSEHFDELIQRLDEEWSDSAYEGRMTHREPSEADAPENAAELVWQDSGGGLDLTQPFDPEALSRVYLRVRAEQDGLLYLRAVSYGDYLGTSWAPAVEGSAASSLSFAAEALREGGIRQRQVQLESLTESACRYLPYFSLENGGFDSYVPSAEKRYTAAYYPFPDSFSSLAVPDALRENELRYRAYAYERYTRLPAGTRDSLTGLCQAAGLSDTDDLIRDVAAYVQQTGHYSLETAPYPSGDYAVYFLTASREGWCLHFATAAVALYRTLGIPARLVEGFLAEAEAGRFVDVKGLNAHAWVEVYQDGLGWLPVEVTGRNEQEAAALGASEPTPEPSPESSTAPQGEVSEASPMPIHPTENESPPLPVGLLTQESLEQAQAAGAQSRGYGGMLLWLLAAVLLLSLLPLRRLLLLSLRRRSFEQADAGKAVIAMYRCALRASAYGLTVPEELVSCAEKAVFSRQGVGSKERERCRSLYARFLLDGAARLRPFARFRLRWITVL